MSTFVRGAFLGQWPSDITILERVFMGVLQATDLALVFWMVKG